MRNLITRQKAKMTSKAQSKAKRAWPPGIESDEPHSPARIKLRGAVMHVPTTEINLISSTILAQGER